MVERSPRPLLVDVLPDVAEELSSLLREEGEQDLADQVATLRIRFRCDCSDDFCAMFYTAPPPKDTWGPEHRNIALEPKQGDMILDVVGERIVAVEILFHEAVRQKLDELFSRESEFTFFHSRRKVQ